jgi:diguanylate cyclase (GGDEF)-like protein
MEKFPELQEHFNILKMDEGYIDYFNKFARSTLRSNPIYMKEVMEYLLTIAEERNYAICKAWCLIWLGWYYFDVSNYDKAIEFHTEGNRIFTELDNAEGIIASCNSLLSDYSQIGLYDMSIEWGLLGITTAEREKDYTTLPSILVNTGVVYISLEYYNEAKELLEQLNVLPYKLLPDTKVTWYQAMANVELHLGDLKQATIYIESGINIAKEEGYDLLLADILYVSAEVKAKQGRDMEAIKDFEEALKLSLKVNELNLASTILIKWSKYRISVKDYKGALENSLRARDITEQIKSKPLLLEVYKDLSDIYKLLGDFEKAMGFLELHSACQKDIFNNVSSISLAKMKNNQTLRQASVYKTLYKQIELISTIGRKLTANLNLDGILDIIYEEVNGLVKAEIFGMAIYKVDEEALDYELFIENNKKKDMGYVSISDEASLGAYCFRNKTDIFINDIDKEYSKYIPRIKRFDKLGTYPNSLIYCPLLIGERIVGFINIQSYKKNAYSLNDLNLLKALASYVAIAIENAGLFDRIQKIANYDYLTGLFNRREIFINGETAFYRCKRYGEKLCVAMIDLDGFKKINDIYGHNAGDIVIKMVAKIIKTSIRESDFAGRYGGDEFLVVLPHTNCKEAYALMERMRKAVEKHEIKYSSTTIINVTISVGIFQINENTVTFDEGVVASDAELYKSKEAGRNKVLYTKV